MPLTLAASAISTSQTPALEGVVNEARPGHRLDRAADLVAVAEDPGRQHAERPGFGSDGGHLDRPTVLIEHVHIEPLTRQVQSGVQHRWGLPVLVVTDDPQPVTGEATLHDIP
jgi:hypothetical protein